ncbi:hypothetical protein [Paracoccus shanxieyensis]|uniref:SGNH/GDSL hydrolase family protein n=1 Tax=Paracoccus shanxieyensis TaxID=2675752 RepID=A0A6L6IY56_9RHOB|nr:hypothetical protein [Paracoccus shanxieyensis]MTH63287.1 hypothetical protein [Paracoccus shanxieyensis]MTH87201.1 hypothetical protein [Paracoccus shanxieyensis]
MTAPKLLILGNSHTAASRVALRDDPERWPGFCPDVFAMPGETLADLDLQDGALHPPNAEIAQKMRFYNQTDRFSLTGYDAFVLIGGLSVNAVSALQDRHRSVDFPSVAAGQDCCLVSSGLIDALIADRIEASPALRILRKLAGLSARPVLFIDQVLPSSDCRDDPQRFAGYVAMVARGDGMAFRDRYLRVLHRVLGGDAIHLPQPAQTIADGVFSAPEWMRGSVRMNPRRDVLHEVAEHGHANAAYGALQVDQILRAL